jgi:cytochrome c-type biogenesis protein CcmH/NrfG
MLRRRTRTDRLAAEAKGLPPAVYIAVAAVVAAGLVGLAYLVRRRLWQAVAVVADAVEEVADTVEDAAEDVRDAARARAG